MNPRVDTRCMRVKTRAYFHKGKGIKRKKEKGRGRE